jgi:aldose 1-epimerase
VFQQKLRLSCSRYLPVDETQIPTGELKAVENTVFDFISHAGSADGNGRYLGEAIPHIDGGGRLGIDHCFVVSEEAPAQAQAEIAGLACQAWVPTSFSAAPSLRHVATLTDEASGRQLVLHASQPGVQVYTANWLSLDAKDAPHTQHNAVCLETQDFPDAPNQPQFPDTILRPGKEYRHRAVFSFKTIP